MVEMSGRVFVFGRFDLVEFVVAHCQCWIFVGSVFEYKGVYTLYQKRQEAIVGPLSWLRCTAQNPQLPRTGVMSPTRISAHNHC